MAKPKLVIEVVGDASALSRSFKKASGDADKFGSTLSKVGKIAMGGLVAGVGLAVITIDKSVKAAVEAEKAQARLDVAFRNAGLSAKKYAAQIDEAESSGRKLGFTDEDVKKSLGSLLTATGSVGKSLKDLSVAQDIARFKNVGLEDATKMLTLAMTGSQRAAKQLGITIPAVSDAVDKLKRSHVDLTSAAGKLELAHAKLQDKMATGQAVIDAVSAKVKGQGQAFADTTAGGVARYHAEMDHLQVTLGNVFLPVLNKVTGGIGDFLTKINNAEGGAAKFKVVVDQVGQVAGNAWTALSTAFKNIDWGKVWDGVAASLKTGAASITKFLQTTDWNVLGKEIGDGIETAVKKFVTDIDWVAVAKAISKGIQAAVIAYAKLTAGIGEAIGSAIVGGIGDGMTGLGNLLSTKLTAAASSAKKAAVSAGASLGGWVKSGVDGVGGLLSGAFQSAVNHAIDLLNAAIRAYNAIPLAPNISQIPHVGGGGGAPDVRPGPNNPNVAGPPAPTRSTQSVDNIPAPPTQTLVYTPEQQQYIHNDPGSPGGHTAGFADGGPVMGGIPITVGERGRELFVPWTDGMIVPNGGFKNGRGGGGALSFGGGAITINVSGVVGNGEAVANEIRKHLYRIQNRNGSLGFV